MIGLALCLAVYPVLAYVVLPGVWRVADHPALSATPTRTVDSNGISGDPINVALVGTLVEVDAAMMAIGWQRADPLTPGRAARIAGSVVFDRPYRSAPVSPLFLFDRPQDMAYEREIGDSASARHHVRWWRSAQVHGPAGAGAHPLWVGGATLDRRVELSHRTAAITHHVDADVDAERDGLMAALDRAGCLSSLASAPGMGATDQARNAGGDPFHTDGRMIVGRLRDCGGKGG